MQYLYLVTAILYEVTATMALKSSERFTRAVPSTIVVAGYASAFYFLSLCLQRLSIGIVYATWAGVGIVLIALLGLVIHLQHLHSAAVVGMALIVTGVIVINVWSTTQIHKGTFASSL